MPDKAQFCWMGQGRVTASSGSTMGYLSRLGLCSVSRYTISIFQLRPVFGARQPVSKPLHYVPQTLWRVLYGPQKLWELGELAEYGNVEKYIPRHAKKPEEIGLGRNCITFEFLRQWPYRNIRTAKVRGNFVMWQADCNNRRLIRNADFAYPLGGREVWHIAKSVAMWTWRRFDLEASDRRFQKLQAHRIRQRWGDNEEKRASVRLMAAAGCSSREIAAQLAVNQSTVVRWLKG